MKGIKAKIGVYQHIFTFLLFTLLLTNSSVKAQLVGGTTYSINGTQSPPSTFSTVANAFTYLNANGVTGSGTIVLEIATGYTGETGTIPALTAYTGMGSATPIVLKPASGQTPTITTSPAANSAVIRFNGAKYFTIDGSNNGSTSRNLTIAVNTSNTLTTTRIIDLVPTGTSTCKFITVKNTNLLGSSSTSTIYTYAGIYLGSGTASPGAAALNGNDSNTFQNNVIGAIQNGIFLRGTNATGQYDTYNRVLDNVIGGTVAPGGSQNTNFFGGVATVSGIYLNSQQKALIQGNTVRNSIQTYYYARGIHLEALSSGGASNKDITINANRIYNLVYSGTGLWANHGIRVQINNNTANNILITNNFIANIAADVDNTSGSFEYGVLSGIHIPSNATSNNTNAGVYIYHNSINLYDNGTQKIASRNNTVTCIAAQTYIAGGVHVKNNILKNTYPGIASTSKALALYSQNTTNNPFTTANNGSSDYNNFFLNGNNVSNIVANVKSTDYTSLTSWQANSVDANSLNVDPVFTDNINLYTASSELDNLGTPVGVNTDIDNNARSTTAPDIGATEYTSPPIFNVRLDQLVGLNTGCNLGTKNLVAKIKNVGGNTVAIGDTLALWYSINGAAKVWDTIFVSTNLLTNDYTQLTFSTAYNFSAFSTYNIYVGVKYRKDQRPNNDSIKLVISNFNCINANPFVADFETGDRGFTQAGGWARGVPAKAIINTAGSGKIAWLAENLTGQYSDDLRAYLYSPLFDFTTACQPSVTWLMRYNMESNWDAVVFEVTTDNVTWTKVNTVTPVYNSTSTSGPVPPNKWTGDNGSWQKYTADLSAYANSPMLGFRYFFGTDASGHLYDGVGVDSIAVEFYPPLGTVSVLSGLQNDTAFIKAPYTFTSSVAGKKGLSHRWYVDNVLVDSVNGYLNRSWLTTGSSEIKYVVRSCAEADSIIIPIKIVTPVGKPSIDFIADRYTANVGEVVGIKSLTGNGAFAWQWIVSPDLGFDYLAGIPSQTYNFVGSSTDPNTSLFFFLGDDYDVCLVAENVNGTDTLCKSEYLSISNSFNICSYPNVIFPTGKIFDSGLSNGSYANSDNCTTFIEPDCADTIFVKLNKLATEANADYLRIYDGNDKTGKPLWDNVLYPQGLSGKLGSVLNLPSVMTATSGFVTVKFASNGSVVDDGFELQYWTKTATQKPTAGFNVPAGILCPLANISVTNTTTARGSTNYSWDIDGDGIDDFTDKEFTYQYSTPGTYKIRMVASNCVGADTAYRTVIVQTPTVAPTTAFGANITNPAVGDEVMLVDSTPGCVQGIQWIITPNTFSYNGGTSSSSKSPQLIFNAPGCYTVKLLTWNGVGYDSLERSCYFNVKAMCVPFVSQQNTDIGISRVKLNTIDNQSDAGTQSYANYTNTYSTTLIKGAVYELTIERPTALNKITRKAWIDFNQDGTFDASEVVAAEAGTQTLTFKSNITIPRSALTGYTRLRVGVVFSNTTINPCASNFIGEFEDYRIILIDDAIKPVITLTGADTIFVERGRPYTELGATALDNVDGDITSKIVLGGTVDTTLVGFYPITYDVTDSTGNKANRVTRIVSVTPDVTKPIVTLNGNAHDTIYVFTSYPDLGATATDIVDGNLTSIVLLSSNLDTAKVGTYTLTYSATDLSGNTGDISRLVTVIDTAKPVIVLTGNNPLIWAVNTPYVDPGHQVIDNYDTGLVATITGVVNYNVTGTYQLYFDVIDNSGDSATTVMREVIVVDTLKPIVTIVGPSTVTIDVFTSYVELGSNAIDNYDDSLPPVTIVGAVDTAVVGDYDLKYVITDVENNTSDTVIRTVKVVDRVAPVVLVHNPIVIERGQPKPSLADSVDYTDNYYPKQQLTLNITENIDVLKEGFYTVEYVVTDPSGNSSAVAKGFVYVTTATGILPTMVSNTSVNVYPNPATNTAFVALDFAGETSVTISVYNITGQKVMEVIPQGTAASRVVELNVETLAAGNYFVHVQGNSGIAIKKLIIAK
jgi:hypothetical protein